MASKVRWWKSASTGRCHILEELSGAWAMCFCQICSIPGEEVSDMGAPCPECMDEAGRRKAGLEPNTPRYRRSVP